MTATKSVTYFWTWHQSLWLSISNSINIINILYYIILSVQKIKTNLDFYRNSARKSTFRTQNDTDKAKFRCTADKKVFLIPINSFFLLDLLFFYLSWITLNEESIKINWINNSHWGSDWNLKKFQNFLIEFTSWVLSKDFRLNLFSSKIYLTRIFSHFVDFTER